MADITLDSFITGIHGSLGDLIYYTRYGKTCVRRKWKVIKPQSMAQKRGRDRFKAASSAWKALSEEEKTQWNSITRKKRMTGYNAFMKERLTAGTVCTHTPQAVVEKPKVRSSSAADPSWCHVTEYGQWMR